MKIDNIKVFVFDFDGVLTNNIVQIDENGKETKTKALEKDFLGCRPKQMDFDEKPDLVKRRVSRFKNYPREYTHVAMQTFITEFFLYIYI